MLNEQLHELISTTRERQRQRIRPGDVVWTWCSKHMTQTDHVWDGHKLWCLECHVEKRPNAN